VTSFAEGKEELANGNDIDYVGAANPQNLVVSQSGLEFRIEQELVVHGTLI